MSNTINVVSKHTPTIAGGVVIHEALAQYKTNSDTISGAFIKISLTMLEKLQFKKENLLYAMDSLNGVSKLNGYNERLVSTFKNVLAYYSKASAPQKKEIKTLLKNATSFNPTMAYIYKKALPHKHFNQLKKDGVLNARTASMYPSEYLQKSNPAVALSCITDESSDSQKNKIAKKFSPAVIAERADEIIEDLKNVPNAKTSKAIRLQVAQAQKIVADQETAKAEQKAKLDAMEKEERKIAREDIKQANADKRADAKDQKRIENENKAIEKASDTGQFQAMIRNNQQIIELAQALVKQYNSNDKTHAILALSMANSDILNA